GPRYAHTPFPYTTLFRSLAEKVNGHDRSSALGHPRGGRFHVDQETVGRDVAEHRRRPGPRNGPRRGEKGKRGTNHLVARPDAQGDRKSTRLNSSHAKISY